MNAPRCLRCGRLRANHVGRVACEEGLEPDGRPRWVFLPSLSGAEECAACATLFQLRMTGQMAWLPDEGRFDRPVVCERHDPRVPHAPTRNEITAEDITGAPVLPGHDEAGAPLWALATLRSTRVCLWCHQQRDQHRDNLQCQVAFDGRGGWPRWTPSRPGAFGCVNCRRLLAQSSWNARAGAYNDEHICVAHDPRPDAQNLHRRNREDNELARLRFAVAQDLRLCMRCGERLAAHGQRMGCAWTPSLEGAAACASCSNPEMRVFVANVGRQVCPTHLPRGLPIVITSIDPPVAPLQVPRGITFRDEAE